MRTRLSNQEVEDRVGRFAALRHKVYGKSGLDEALSEIAHGTEGLHMLNKDRLNTDIKNMLLANNFDRAVKIYREALKDSFLPAGMFAFAFRVILYVLAAIGLSAYLSAQFIIYVATNF